MFQHVGLFSGGTASWLASKRVAGRYGTEHLALVFQNTKAEHHDAYRFLVEAVHNVFGRVVDPELLRYARTELLNAEGKLIPDRTEVLTAWLHDACPQFFGQAEGRTPTEVFRDERFLGNNLVAPCSRILKKEVGDRWLKEHCDPAETTVYLGMDWTEGDRHKSAAKRFAPYTVVSPLAQWKPYVTKAQAHAACLDEGMALPKMYELYANNNCGGLCIRAGQGHWVTVLKNDPEGFASMEALEGEISELTGKPVSILRNRHQGHEGELLPLKELRRMHSCGEQIDMFDLGACGCDAYVGPEA